MIDMHKHKAEFARAIQNGHYEANDDGILLRGSNVFIGGALKFKDYRAMSTELAAIKNNMLLAQGLTHILNVVMPPSGGYAQVTQWYFAPFSGNYTPNPAHTAAQLPAASTEFTNYTASARLPVTISAASTGASTGNTGNEAQCIFSGAGPYNIYGVNIVSSSAKSATTGIALASIRLATPKLGFVDGEKVGFEYVLSAADAG